MKTKTFARILLVLEMAMVLIIAYSGNKYHRETTKSGGEMSDGFVPVELGLAAIYYAALLIWTVFIFSGSRHDQKPVRIQLGILTVLCLVPIFIFFIS